MPTASRTDGPVQFSLAALLFGVGWLAVFLAVERYTEQTPYNRMAGGLALWAAIGSGISLHRGIRQRLGRRFLLVLAALFLCWLSWHVVLLVRDEPQAPPSAVPTGAAQRLLHP